LGLIGLWDVLMSSVPASQQLYWPVDEIGAPAIPQLPAWGPRSTVEHDPPLVREFLAITKRGYYAAVAEPALALRI